MGHVLNQQEEFEQAILSMDTFAARKIIENLLESLPDSEHRQSIEKLVVHTMECIGVGWESGEVALSQVYMGGRICEKLLSDITFSDTTSHTNQLNTALVVLEDRHMLGKRIVSSSLISAGLDFADYGSMQADDLVGKVAQDEIEVLLISALMLPSALRVEKVRELLEARGIKAHIVVGGAPFRFDKQLWKQVRADCMGETASDAVAILKKLNDEKKNA